MPRTPASRVRTPLAALAASASLALAAPACGHRIPAPGPVPVSRPAPPVTPPARVCWVEFSQGTLPHGLVVAHRALTEDVVSTQSGLLILDPRGDWLIDGGSALDYEAQIQAVPPPDRLFLKQAARGWSPLRPIADVLADAGAPARLTGLIPTHGHFDHLGGLADLPDAPVWMPQPEIDLIPRALAGDDTTILPGDAARLQGRARPITWEDRPFLAWERQWDLYGDGSVVVLDTPGHTPGSLSVYVALPGGGRALLVGDTVWVREGFEQREPKGALAASFDADPRATDDQIARLWSLHQQDPSLPIVPAHDRRSWLEVFKAPCGKQ